MDCTKQHCTYVSGEVPGLLGAGFAEAASLPDSTKQVMVNIDALTY